MKPQKNKLLFGLFALTLSAMELLAQQSSLVSGNVKPPQYGFIENAGQILDENQLPNTKVRYLLAVNGMNVQLKHAAFSYDTYVLRQDGMYHFHRIDVELVNANPDVRIVPLEESQDAINYYNGISIDVARTRSYNKVVFQEIYRGIDLVFKTNAEKSVEYDFVVHPGADPSQIQLKYTGSLNTQIQAGQITLALSHGDLTETIPKSFLAETNEPLLVTYSETREGTVRFHVPAYDAAQTLVIDPTPSDRNWGTFYGGTGADGINDMVVDGSGNVYLVGTTASAASIATGSSHQTTIGGGQDAMIVKLNSSGVRQWATYYGGTGTDIGSVIGLDASLNIYVMGHTNSSGLATDGSLIAGGNDLFLVRLNNANGTRSFATLWGGTLNETVSSMLISGTSIYFGGETASTTAFTFPASPAPYLTTRTGGGYIGNFSNGGNLVWLTYLEAADVSALALSSSGDLIAGGIAAGASATAGAHQTTNGGGVSDGFLASMTTNGTTKNWMTFYGGTGQDRVSSIRTNTSGIYIGGYTTSTSAIATGTSAFLGGTSDGFLAQFSNTGVRQWGLYVGTSAADEVEKLALHTDGSIFYAGQTTGVDATAGSYQTVNNGNNDIFFGKIDPLIATNYASGGLPILWRTNYGGASADVLSGLAVAGTSTATLIYLAGTTGSSTVMFSAGAHQTTNGGSNDGFVASFDDCGKPGKTPAITVPAGPYTTGQQYTFSVGATYNATTYSWILPSGWTGSSTTNSILVTVGSVSGVITVSGTNACGGGLSTSTATLTPVADVAPTILSFSPADNAISIAVASNLVATFSENVTAVTSKIISIKRTSDNVIFESYTLPHASVIVSGATVTINPTASLLPGTGYYVNMDVGAFQDAGGNNFTGITNTTIWNFTTSGVADVTAPTISSLSPTDNLANAAIATDLVATFSENVTAVAAKVVSIRRSSDNTVFESYTLPSGNVAVSGTTVTINPTASLANSVGYYVNIDAGAFEDAAGNDFAGIANNSTWNFTTVVAADVTPPTITTLSPLDNATGVAVASNLVATFSENVTAVATKVVSIRRASDNAVFESYTLPSGNVVVSGTTVTINPTGSLANSVGYYVNMDAGAFEDVAGNDFAGITNTTFWSFTTVAGGDVTPPTVTSFSPTDNATVVPVNTNLVMTFSENVNVVSSKIVRMYRLSDNQEFETIVLPDARVSVSGSTVTINPSADFSYSTGYFVLVEGGAFEDVAGNDFAGFFDNATWNFTTAAPADATPPNLISVSPVDNATGVSVSSNFVLTFSENVAAGSSKAITIRRSSDGNPFENYFLPHANVSISGATVTVNPSGTLVNSLGYYITIEPGAIEDLVGNDFAGFADNATWNFTTEAVALQNQTITFNALAAKTFGDAAFGLTATASSGLPVSYTSSNTAVATVSGSTVTIVGAGTTTITASQAGNGSFNPAPAVQQTLMINKANQTITFGALAAKTFGDANFTLGATANSSLGVSYSSSNTAVATVSGNLVTIVGAGSTFITASQGGNSNFNVAADVQQTLTVNKANQTITFGALPGKQTGDAAFGLTATASSGLTISYASSNTAVATVSGSTVTVVGAGSTTITAAQSGNANFNAATPVNQILSVTNSDTQPPTITLLSPLDNATAVPIDANLVITFSENIIVGSGSLRIRYVSDNSLFSQISTVGAVISGNTLTINTSDFEYGAQYYVDVDPGYVKDASNNLFAGLVGNPNWTFTTVKLDQTITFGSLATKTFGETAFNLTASASSGLPVSYSSSNTSVATISSNTVVIVGAGSTIITASQAGNSTYNAASNVQQTLTVNKENQTITFSALPSKTFGDASFTLGATASSGLSVSYTSSNTAVATISGNTVTIVSAGSTTITASHGGNANFNAATNVQQTLTVNKASQAITFSAVASKTFGDASFTLGATASSGLPVSYTSSNTAIATISGNTVTIVGAGSTTITASQAGNSNYNPATNVQQILTVNKANQTITFSALTTKTFGDVNFALGATVSSGLSVSYVSSNTAIATISGNTVTIVGAGSTTITASQAGNSNYNPATNVQQLLTVNKANQTVTFSALTAKTFGDVNFALSATASSGLSVSYVSSNAAVATISGNTVTIVGAGSTTITASQVGNANYNTATNVAQTLLVNKAGQTISFTAIPSKTLGDPAFGLVATASSGLPLTFSSGNLSVATISGSILTIVGAGTSTISATQVGNVNYNSITVDQILTVANPILQNQTITFSALPTKTFGNAAFTLSASASSGLAVSFTSSNTSVVTITGNTATIVGAGNATISAQQSGNAAFNAAPVVQQLLTVNKAVQTLTFGTLITKTFGDVPYTITASSTSGLPVSFSSSNTLIASIAGNTITVVGAGSTTITASQGGDANYQAASTVVQPITVNKANQSITFGSLAAKGVNDPPFSLTATASSGLTVTYTSSNTAVATVSGSTVTLVGQGTTTITAVQSGNTNYNAAASVGQSLTVNAKQSQTISFAALPSKTLNDAAFGLSATASSGLAVSYTSSNTAVATINGSTVTIVGAGATTITAAQAGDATFNAAPSVQQTLNVNKLDQTIFFTALGSKQLSEGTITLAATATSGLAVTYTSSNPTVATVSGATLTLLSAGNTTITATQSGNDNYNAATNINNELVVSDKQAQTITFAALASKTFGDAAFTLNATASSGLTVSYTSSNSAVATISGNTVTLVGAGSVTIHANQAGSATFSAATQVSQSFCVNPAKPVIAATGLNTNAPVLKSSSATGNQWFKNTELLPGATNEALSITGPGVYKVRVSAGSCISAFSDDFAVIVTGDLSTQAHVSIYPNPATHLLQVSLPEDGQVREVSVFNLQGQRLEAHQVQSTSVQVDVQPYAPGTYLLQVSTGRQQQVIRFIKK